jgi:large subunit ribosomal protein L5
MVSLETQFRTKIIPELQKSLGLSSPMGVPRLEKIVLNAGIGRLVISNPQNRERILAEVEKILSLITGQKPARRKAHKSVSGFKVRAGEVVGLQVTLRGKRMYDFLARFLHLALPRSRDFRGIPEKSVDGHGNLTIGIREHIIFPEVAAEDVKQLYGFEVTLVPTTRSRARAVALFRALGVPFQRG